MTVLYKETFISDAGAVWREGIFNGVLQIHRPAICVANPIDLLAKYANMTEEDVDIEIQEPYNLLKVCIQRAGLPSGNNSMWNGCSQSAQPYRLVFINLQFVGWPCHSIFKYILYCCGSLIYMFINQLWTYV